MLDDQNAYLCIMACLLVASIIIIYLGSLLEPVGKIKPVKLTKRFKPVS